MEDGVRTTKSLAFQERWQSLRANKGLIPTVSIDDLLEFADMITMVGIVGLDIEKKSLPIHFAGSRIKDIAGFEPTGRDFTEFDLLEDKEKVWYRRLQYFKHPCGFYEVTAINTPGMGPYIFAVTMFPIYGETKDPRLMVFLEVKQPSIDLVADKQAELVVAEAIARFPIDIGAGVPAGFDE